MSAPRVKTVAIPILVAGIVGFGLAFGVLVYAATDEGRTMPLVGPCASRVASDDTYLKLALKLLSPKIDRELTASEATPDRVREAHETYATLRRDYLPTVTDACLRAHVSDWLDWYDGRADEAARERLIAPAERNDYEAQQAREQDQVRALASHLGVQP